MQHRNAFCLFSVCAWLSKAAPSLSDTISRLSVAKYVSIATIIMFMLLVPHVLSTAPQCTCNNSVFSANDIGGGHVSATTFSMGSANPDEFEYCCDSGT